VRLVDGKRQPPSDAGSSRATLDDLSRRGYTAANAQDIEKIALLASQAVGEAIEDHTGPFPAEERRSIEEDARRRFDRLLSDYRQSVAPGAGEGSRQGAQRLPAGLRPELSEIPGLSGMIADAIQTELVGAVRPGRLDAIDRQMSLLADGLKRTEKGLEQLTSWQRTPNRDHRKDPIREVWREQQKIILDEVFENNIRLQSTQSGAGEEH